MEGKFLLKFVRIKYLRLFRMFARFCWRVFCEAKRSNFWCSCKMCRISNVCSGSMPVDIYVCLCQFSRSGSRRSHACAYNNLSIYLTHNKCDIYNIQQRCIFISSVRFTFRCVPSWAHCVRQCLSSLSSFAYNMRTDVRYGFHSLLTRFFRRFLLRFLGNP